MRPTNDLDPQRLLQSLQSMHARVFDSNPCRHLELYHRRSAAFRVRHDGPGAILETRSGIEEGLAVRLQRGETGESSFAATTGGDEASLAWAVAQASAALGEQTPDAGFPVGSGPLTMVDHDHDHGVPHADEVEAWAGTATAGLKGAGCRLSPGAHDWIEVASTVESWVTDGGRTASRTRQRAWALAQRSGDTAAPLMVASRGWRFLPVDGWSTLFRSRQEFDPWREDRTPVLIGAEAAARLVAALVRATHAASDDLGRPVGPGWCVSDAPETKQALFGGVFDDAGYSSARRPLADGRTVLGIISGPGHYRRPSFRNPPEPFPSSIEVEGPAVVPPDGHRRISELAIHPLEPGRWVLEVAAGAEKPPAFIQTSPGRLVERCVGTVGASQSSFHGVITPALLFETL